MNLLVSRKVKQLKFYSGQSADCPVCVLSWPVLNRSGLPWEVSALYGNFETACMLRISLVAEFGKLILILYASIFSEKILRDEASVQRRDRATSHRSITVAS